MTAALEGGEWLASRSGRTLPRERLGTHFTGVCVGPRVGLDGIYIYIYVYICGKGKVIPLQARCGPEGG